MTKLFLTFSCLWLSVQGFATPLVINTWSFRDSAQTAWDYVNKGFNAVDALVEGCSVCERHQCDGTVGFGGSPDENGETTLDAMIFDGATMNMGGVSALREIKDAIAVAKHVLQHTTHSLLAGSQATEFAAQVGFKKEPLSTSKSTKIWSDWKNDNCQPNSWINVQPNPKESCGPYTPISENSVFYDRYWKHRKDFSENNHDTIGMIIIDKDHNIAAGTSTNGMTHKIPGRVGDSPIPGSGAYADNAIGAACATGDGDVMMRFAPAAIAVQKLEDGLTPSEAASFVIKKIARHYPDYFGAIVVVSKSGEYAVACNGMDSFRYSIASDEFSKATILEHNCK